MSGEEADLLMQEYEKWDNRSRKRDFLARMERKLYRKERLNRH